MLGATCVECPAHKATLSTAQQMQHLVQIIIRTGFLSYKNSASNCCSFTNDMHAALRLSREAFRRSKSAPVSFPIRISDIAAESTALCIAALSCKGGMISSVCRGKRRPHLVIEGVARHNLGTEPAHSAAHSAAAHSAAPQPCQPFSQSTHPARRREGLCPLAPPCRMPHRIHLLLA